MVRFFLIGLMSTMISMASLYSVAADNDKAGDLCPDANILSTVIDGMCWSCLLPIRLAGIGGDAPKGAASSKPFCMCADELGVPEWGIPLGFFQPSSSYLFHQRHTACLHSVFVWQTIIPVLDKAEQKQRLTIQKLLSFTINIGFTQ